jgi:hypothetical protein
MVAFTPAEAPAAAPASALLAMLASVLDPDPEAKVGLRRREELVMSSRDLHTVFSPVETLVGSTRAGFQYESFAQLITNYISKA